MSTMKRLEEYVVSIPDFPEPGIIFRDVTSILQDADGLHMAIDKLREMVKDLDFDVVVGPESRGFIFGVPLPMQSIKVLFRYGKKESFQEKPFLQSTIWSMVLRRLRFIRMRLNQDRR